MNKTKHAVILVYATSHALRAETILAEAGIESKLIPVPRHLSSDCGVCLRISQEDMELANDTLTNANLDFDGVYKV
jgi:hypothetical protein